MTLVSPTYENTPPPFVLEMLSARFQIDASDHSYSHDVDGSTLRWPRCPGGHV